MPYTCPQCSHINPDNSGFCVSCGNKLPQNSTFSETNIGSAVPTYVSPQPTSQYTSTSAPMPPAYNPPSAPMPPAYNPSSAPMPPVYNPSSYPPSSYPPSSAPPQQWPMQGLPPAPGTQMRTAQGMTSIRRAFAGYGTLVMHHSWLLTGDSAQTVAIRNAVRDKLQQRGIARLTINPVILMERGIPLEEREYLLAQRGVSTVFIYVAPAGQDLYISRATTVLPVISYIRVAILSLLFLIMIVGYFTQPQVGSLFTGGAGTFLFESFLNLLSGPLFLFFIVLLILSFIYWLREKDFLRIVRSNFLDDFNLDDLILLEHVTDDSVREVVEQLGLNAAKIVPPAPGYQPKQKIRAI